MGRLVEIQTALKPLKKSEKIEIHFTTLFNGLLLRIYKIWGREILTQSSFKSSICAIKILN